MLIYWALFAFFTAGALITSGAAAQRSRVPLALGAVVIATRPEHAAQTMRECAELGISHVWMHRGPGTGSVSASATDDGRAQGITVIDGGCPCMFDPTSDLGHKVMRLVFTLAGNVPREVPSNGAVADRPET